MENLIFESRTSLRKEMVALHTQSGQKRRFTYSKFKIIGLGLDLLDLD